MMIRLMTVLFALCLGLSSILAQGSTSKDDKAVTPHASSTKQHGTKRIAMILWRGETAAEVGFKEYFNSQKRDIKFEVYDCKKDKSRLKNIIKQVKLSKPDLVYTFGTTVTLNTVGAFDAIEDHHVQDIPVVFCIVADPVGAKLVKSFETSERNLTGVSHLVPYESQLLSMLSVRTFKKLGIIYNPSEKNSVLAVSALQEAGPKHGIEIIKAPILTLPSGKVDSSYIEVATQRLIKKQPDYVYLPSDSLIISESGRFLPAIHEAGIPTFSATETPIIKHAALMGLVSNYRNVGQFAGFKAEQILFNGKTAHETSIETLKRFTFTLNMKTAHQLKFYPPVKVLRLAKIVGLPEPEAKPAVAK